MRTLLVVALMAWTAMCWGAEPGDGKPELTMISGAVKKTGKLKTGDYEAEGVLVVPKGITLVVEAGAYLKLPKGFNVAGKLVVAGTKEKPVYIECGAVRPILSGETILRYCRMKGSRPTLNGTLNARKSVFDGVMFELRGKASFDSCILRDAVWLYAYGLLVEFKDSVFYKLPLNLWSSALVTARRLDIVDAEHGIRVAGGTSKIEGLVYVSGVPEHKRIVDVNDDARLGRAVIGKLADEPFNPKMIEFAKKYKFEPPYHRKLDAWKRKNGDDVVMTRR